jgi:ADP-ribose pyrophosphatase YjhB (NUDIX family)
VGYSPSEVAVKEVLEETGIECEPMQILAVIDGQRMGFTRFAMYLLLFHCTATGGDLRAHPLETKDVGWFKRDELPWPVAGASWWGPMAFAAIDGHPVTPAFEAPRSPMWRGPTG